VQKIKVIHFHNGSGGGVLSVIKNLVQFSQHPFIEHHVLYTINLTATKYYPINNIKGAASEQVFYYSPKWNFYYTCKQLYKLIDKNALLVAHDWLELGMISNLGLQNKVISFLHGDYDYYYQLAMGHQQAVDAFFCIANSIQQQLIKKANNVAVKIFYTPFPVPNAVVNANKVVNNNIVFIGRLTNEKGYPILPIIDAILQKNGVCLHWHIVGESNVESIMVKWDKNANTYFYGNIDNEKVMKLLENMTYFILPSIAEGMPVSLIEAMKASLVSFVNDINGGIQQLIENNVTGFKINNNEPLQYANAIISIINNLPKIELLQKNANEMANKLFNPIINAQNIENLMYEIYNLPGKVKFAKKVYGSRLDQTWIPNYITQILRNNN
jgi:glycosyltransferase involved in cell wall biosynthesis